MAKHTEPIKFFPKATIYFREGGHEDVFEVNVYGNFAIYFNHRGNECLLNIHQIKQLIMYHDEETKTTDK